MKLCLSILLVLAPQYLVAQELKGLTASSEAVSVNEKVNFDVHLKVARDLVWCGLRVDFGDGETRDIRVEENPSPLTKAYAAPGKYTVRATGKGLVRGLKSALPCLGDAQAVTVAVANPAAELKLQEEKRAAQAAAEDLARREHELALREKALKDNLAKQAQDNATRPERAPVKRTPAEPVALPAKQASAPSAPASRPRDESLKVFK